jgi:PIN domain nuclease of toxin-antitoxin system
VELLLDTHTFLWYVTGDSQLSAQAKSDLDNRQNLRYVSLASLWEMAIKYSIGKLELREPYETLIPRLLQVNEFYVLNLSIAHLSEVAKLSFPDPNHKDPFDCLIVAQSKVEEIPVLSVDQKLDAYGIHRRW